MTVRGIERSDPKTKGCADSSYQLQEIKDALTKNLLCVNFYGKKESMFFLETKKPKFTPGRLILAKASPIAVQATAIAGFER